MKHGKKLIPLLAVASLAVAGCEGQGPKQLGGTLIGAAAGGVLGAQAGKGRGKLVTTAIGTLAGAWLGSEVGKSLDRADRLAMSQTTQKALEKAETGQVSSWKNPDSGNSGTITPRKTYQRASGQYCREYQQTITVGGKTEQAYGTACRQPDGTWKIAG